MDLMVVVAAVAALVGIVASLSGVIIGWTGRAKEAQKNLVATTKAETEKGTLVSADVQYIKRGIDDIRADLRAQGTRVDTICERVAKVEEVAKSAHKRIDTHINSHEGE